MHLSISRSGIPTGLFVDADAGLVLLTAAGNA